MPNLSFTLLLCIFALPTFAGSIPKVIYGEDNRKDVFESTNGNHKALAKSTAAMIPTTNVKLLAGSDLIQITGKTLQGAIKVCSTENFSSQITAANCSGFLISDTHLVTAGHCIVNNADCTENKWIFDYSFETKPVVGSTEFFIEKSKVFSCRKIIERSQGNGIKDFAVIELDRPVLDRSPLKFRTEGSISAGTPVFVVGHPSGLPTKIADGGKVESTSSIEFVADIDTYGGNSGSAVFNEVTLEVEGILVRGSEDYLMSQTRGCLVSNKCKSIDGTLKCRGEYITKITGIKSLSPDSRPPTDGEVAQYLSQEPNIVGDYAANRYKNCYVKNSHPVYNQLFIKGQHRGNFKKITEDDNLKDYLGTYALNGTCVKKTETELASAPASVAVTPRPANPTQIVFTMPTPVAVPAVTPVTATETVVLPVDPESDKLLIEEFINNKYFECFIKTNVRIYNQLFVRGAFKGNFVMETDNNALAEILRKNISNKLCTKRMD